MAFKKIDITAPVSVTETEFFEQWSKDLSKNDIKTLHGMVLPISKIIKAKSSKGFSLVVTNHCLIWVWSNSKFGELIKDYLKNPIGRPAIVPSLNNPLKSFEFGIDDAIKCVIHEVDERTTIIEPTNPKLP